MEQITIYETQAMTARLTADGTRVAVTFKPHGGLPVSVQMPRASFERFVQQATRELAQATRPDKA
jgi:hypothetical protein